MLKTNAETLKTETLKISVFQLFSISAFSALLLAGWISAGCARHAGRTTHGGSGTVVTGTLREVDSSPEAAEKRAEAHARYAAAVLSDLDDKASAAAEDFYLAAMADPTSEPLVLETTSRLLRAKQADKAIEVLKQSVAQPGASGALYGRLGLAYAVAGQREEAIAANRTAIQRHPQGFSAYQQLAQVYLQNQEIQSGLAVLDQAAARTDTDAAFLIDLAQLYVAFMRAGATNDAKPRAVQALDRASQMELANPLLVQKLAEGYEVLGQSEKAIEFNLRLQKLLPNLPGVRDKLVQLYLTTEDRAKAAEQLRAAIRDNPNNPQPYFFLGSLAMEEQKPEEAVGHFRKTIELRPEFEPAYYELALALINNNLARDAIGTLEKARDRFRQNFFTEFYSGLAYGRLKEYRKALTHFTGAEEIARTSATNRLTQGLYFQLGATHERAQNFKEAEHYFRKALEIAPNFSEALNYLGYMWAERGENLEEARVMIEKAVQLEPKNGAFLDSLGWVLFKMRKPEEALPWIQKSIERSEEPDPTLYDHLGDIYWALNEKDKARAAWEKALTLEPNEIRAAVQKKLDDLKR